MKELANYFKKLGDEKRKIFISGHPHADPDAVGSVIALKEILKSLGAEVTAGIPSDISKLSKSVLKSVDESIEVDAPIEAEIVIVLDTSSLEQLKNYKEKIEELNPEIIFIDHHRPDEKTKKKIDKYYSKENASSTSELILDLAQKLDYKFESKIATLMLTGIISDTGHFKFANEETFRALNILFEHGADYREALEALKTPEDPSKRIAMLKACQRSEIHKAHGRQIVLSEIGAYESDAASLFVKIGADVSLVASENEEKIRISSRSRSGVASETQLHLGELMSNLADHFGGVGGGHAGAAAATLETSLEEAKEKPSKK